MAYVVRADGFQHLAHTVAHSSSFRPLLHHSSTIPDLKLMHNVHKRLVEERRSFAVRRSYATNVDSDSVEARVQRMKDLQYQNDKKLFAVMYTTLHKAALDGDIEGILYFLHRCLNHVEDYDHKGLAAIHYAAEKGYSHMVEVLLKKKCLVDLPSIDEQTPAMLAAMHNHTEVLALLHQHDCNLFATNRSGYTIAHFAAHGNHVEALRCLIDLFRGDREYIHETVTILEEQPILPQPRLSLISRNSESSVTDRHKVFLKGCVAQNSYHSIPINELLIMKDTDVLTRPSRNGMTPLHLAASADSKDALLFLLETGVDPNPFDGNRETPLHKAGRASHFEAYRLLRTFGADAEVRNLTGETPSALLTDDGNI